MTKLTPEIIEKRKAEFRLQNIEMLSEFTRSADKHNFKCLLDNTIWQAAFSDISRGSGCPKCKTLKDKLNSDVIKGRKEGFRLRNIEMIGAYKGSKEKHDFRCLIDGHEWKATFNKVSSGTGCPRCGIFKSHINQSLDTKVIEDRKDRFRLRNIEMISEFKGTNSPTQFRCLIDNHIWSASFNSVYQGSGCPKCSNSIVVDDDKLKRLESLLIRNIRMLDDYTTATYKNTFLCLIDGHQWKTCFNNVYNKRSGCPKCSGRHKTEEENLRVEAQNIIRKRLSGLATQLNIDKPYKTNGTNNELVPYFVEHYITFVKLNPKPLGKDWTLDHIIPVSWYDPYAMEELKLCWNHQNFQWLTGSENSSKNNRLRPQDVAILTAWHYEAIKKASYAKPFQNFAA